MRSTDAQARHCKKVRALGHPGCLGKRWVCCLGMLSILILTGCGQTKAQKPDLSSLGEIHPVAREDGSGTRAQFEELVGTAEEGADRTASSTEDVLAAVEEDPSAIGYVAMSALSEEEDVRILTVDGVTPSAQTVRNQKYPLSRKYYLAWLGDPSDLEQEFLIYVKGAGQKIVAQEAVPVGKETSFLSLQPSGTLRITGSTSMAPMIRSLAEEYRTYNPGASIEVTESDSSQGITDAMQGRADIAMASRDLKDYEKEILSDEGIAMDAIVIIVNRENPLQDLESTELKEIYDGTIGEWADL